MSEKELLETIAKYGTPDFGREKKITSRRYNLVVFRNGDQGKEIVEEIEYLSLSQAKELKAEYLREDNLFSDIIEDVTTDRNGKELSFPEHQNIPVVLGKQIGEKVLGTPEATLKVVERDRNKERSRSSFARKANKTKNGKTIRYTNSWTDPNSPLYSMYMDNVRRKGFTVRNKKWHEVFIGLQDEVTEYILTFFKQCSDAAKTDLDISFNGV